VTQPIIDPKTGVQFSGNQIRRAVSRRSADVHSRRFHSDSGSEVESQGLNYTGIIRRSRRTTSGLARRLCDVGKEQDYGRALWSDSAFIARSILKGRRGYPAEGVEHCCKLDDVFGRGW